MKAYDRRIGSLREALDLCISKNKLITSDKLSEGESIHCCNGRFYYEDGCLIGRNTIHAFNVLSSMEWTGDAEWYDIGTFTAEEYKRIQYLHKLKEAHPAACAFTENFSNLVENMKGHPVWEILSKDKYTSEGVSQLEEMSDLMERIKDEVGENDFCKLYEYLACSFEETFKVITSLSTKSNGDVKCASSFK